MISSYVVVYVHDAFYDGVSYVDDDDGVSYGDVAPYSMYLVK
jgi:hypothetical protein